MVPKHNLNVSDIYSVTIVKLLLTSLNIIVNESKVYLTDVNLHLSSKSKVNVYLHTEKLYIRKL